MLNEVSDFGRKVHELNKIQLVPLLDYNTTFMWRFRFWKKSAWMEKNTNAATIPVCDISEEFWKFEGTFFTLGTYLF